MNTSDIAEELLRKYGMTWRITKKCHTCANAGIDCKHLRTQVCFRDDTHCWHAPGTIMVAAEVEVKNEMDMSKVREGRTGRRG